MFAVFAPCFTSCLLRWCCRLSGKPLHTVTVEYRSLRIEADALVGSAGALRLAHRSRLALHRCCCCCRRRPCCCGPLKHLPCYCACGAAGNPSVLNSAKDVLRLVTLQRPPTVPHTILDGVSGVLKPGGHGDRAVGCWLDMLEPDGHGHLPWMPRGSSIGMPCATS